MGRLLLGGCRRSVIGVRWRRREKSSAITSSRGCPYLRRGGTVSVTAAWHMPAGQGHMLVANPQCSADPALCSWVPNGRQLLVRGLVLLQPAIPLAVQPFQCVPVEAQRP